MTNVVMTMITIIAIVSGFGFFAFLRYGGGFRFRVFFSGGLGLRMS